MSSTGYRSYKDSGVEWLGLVPAHWVVARLKTGFDVRLGKMLQPDAKSPEDELRPYLRAANIQWNGIDLSDLKSMWFSPQEQEQLQLRSGDLLVSEGGDVGRSAIWRDEHVDCLFQNSVNRVRSRNGNDTRFLYYWLAALKAKGYVDVICNKSTIAHFTAEKVAAVPVPFPPIPEQTAIAVFLDHETDKIDALVEEQKRLIELLKEKRQAVISHAVTKGRDPDAPMKDTGITWLGEVPEHWGVVPLKHLTAPGRDIMYGIVLPGPNVEGGVPIVKGGDVRPHKLKVELLNRTTAEIERPFARARLLPNDIVYSIRGTIGDAELVPEELRDANITQDVARIAPREGLNNAWLLYALKSHEIFAQLEVKSLGAAVRGINIFDQASSDTGTSPRGARCYCRLPI